MPLIDAQRIMASGCGRVAFVVADQPPVGGQPRQGPLHHPSARDPCEPLLAGCFALCALRSDQEQADGVGDDEPLTAVDFLGRVVPPGLGVGRCRRP
jgi:hypothetical protein